MNLKTVETPPPTRLIRSLTDPYEIIALPTSLKSDALPVFIR